MAKSFRYLAGTVATSLCVLGLVAAPAAATSSAADCEDLTLVAVLHVTPDVAFEGTAGDDIICGTAGDDVINGGGGNDTIYGLDGNDTITTGSGIDTIDGGLGNDTITSGAGADVITGGAGDDTIKSGDGNDTIRSGDGDDEIDAGNGNDIVFAEADDDNVDGEAGNDQITLGEGDDYAEGGAGADKLWGGDGSDSLIGEAGNDWVNAGEGDDTIKLDAGDDYAAAGPGADLLFGGTGKDALDAGTGSDSLDGGAGADSVNGGVHEGNDKDYCAKDKLDTQQNCFYDSKGPTLVSAAIVSGASINTSESGKMVTVRARVKDGGAGVSNISLSFSRLTKNGNQSGDSIQFSYSPWSWGCDPDNPATLNSNMTMIGCRTAGTDLDGIYEFKAMVPKFTMPGTYVLAQVWMMDSAGNNSMLTTDQIKKKKLAINFKQVGGGDGKPPTLSSISLLTKTVDTSASSQVVTLRAAVKDGTSGVQSVNLTFMRLTKGQAAWQNINFSWWDNPSFVGLNGNCENGGAANPTGNGSTACRVSGNSKAQVIEMKIRLPRYTSAGTYQLQNVWMRDYAGNNASLMLEQLKDKKLAVNFKQTGAGDSSGPTLKEVRILTPNVDSGASAKVVTLKVRVKDNNSGTKSFQIGFGRIKSGQTWPEWTQISGNFSEAQSWDMATNSQILIPEGQCNDDKTHAKEPTITNGMNSMGTVCRISGHAKDGWYEVKVVVPAHAAAGTYKLMQFWGTDAAGNQGNINWEQLKKLKLNIGFKNG